MRAQKAEYKGPGKSKADAKNILRFSSELVQGAGGKGSTCKKRVCCPQHIA